MYTASKHYDIIPKIIIFFSLLIWLFTESLSLFHSLTHGKVLLVWVVAFCVMLVCGLCSLKIRERVKQEFAGFSCLCKESSDWTTFEMVLLFLIIALAGITFVMSFLIVPNNWDSMTYHLARVANWIENRSVAYYPTNNLRQLYYSAFSEYIILHIMLIFQNDKFVNLVQWFAYAASGYMLYRVGRELELKRVHSLLTALLYMLCPLVIAESMTTQVDLVGTMWCLIFAYFALMLGKSSKPLNCFENLTAVFWCAASIGLGYLTKSSVCFAMPFILLWLFVACILKKEKPRNIVICIAFAGLTVLILAAPGFIRNYRAMGDIIPTSEMGRLMIDFGADPVFYLLNMCKNLTIQTVGSAERSGLWKLTMGLADVLGYDIEDRRISAYAGFAEGSRKSFHHDRAGSQMLLIISGIAIIVRIVILIVKRCKKDKENYRILDSYVLSCIGGAILFFGCIRWQPWGNRLMLPSLPFLCLFVTTTFSKWKVGRKFTVVLTTVCILLMLPDAYQTIKEQKVKYIEPKECGLDKFDLYFLNRFRCAAPYRAVAGQVMERNPESIGLLIDGDGYEYPLWTILKTEDNEIHPVVLECGDEKQAVWEPQIIVAINQNIRVEDELLIGNNMYQCIWNYEDNADYAILFIGLKEDD